MASRAYGAAERALVASEELEVDGAREDERRDVR